MMFEPTTEEKAKMLLESPMVQWAELQHGMFTETKQEIVGYLDALIEKAVRLRGYLDHQAREGHTDGKHRGAVQQSNYLACKVRAVLGYSRPRQDVSF
jgi:hypothetical protein